MNLTITHQEKYSRGELLLRTFLGWLYIVIPHFIVLFFLQIWSSILTFLAFWSILFAARYPKSMFNFQVKLQRWMVRVNARLFNLSDGYPTFGLNAEDKYTNFEMPYPKSLSRGLVLLKVLFGWLYVVLPHGIILFFRNIANIVIIVIAWFAVLITGKYPKGMHDFVVGTLRWQLRVMLYIELMTDEYPPFSGKA